MKPFSLRVCLLIVPLLLLSAAPPAHADDSLYRDLGGRAGLVKIINSAAGLWLADDRIKEDFSDINMEWLKPRIVDFICRSAGGPCLYKGRDLAAAHKGLHLADVEFNALAEDLQTAMETLNVPFGTQNRLLALLAPMERPVVTR